MFSNREGKRLSFSACALPLMLARPTSFAGTSIETRSETIETQRMIAAIADCQGKKLGKIRCASTSTPTARNKARVRERSARLVGYCLNICTAAEKPPQHYDSHT